MKALFVDSIHKMFIFEVLVYLSAVMLSRVKKAALNYSRTFRCFTCNFIRLICRKTSWVLARRPNLRENHIEIGNQKCKTIHGINYIHWTAYIQSFLEIQFLNSFEIIHLIIEETCSVSTFDFHQHIFFI